MDSTSVLLLAFRVPVFERRAKRALAAHPKFYYFDVGVFRSIRPAGSLDSPAEIEGAAVEGLVGQHLKAWCDYSKGNHKLFYWQTRSQVEVDFVVYGEKEFFAVEVKRTDQVRDEELRSLKTFAGDYPESRAYLVYGGKEKLRRDKILCIPLQEFLGGLSPGEILV